jgi:hypothetical protein
MDANKNYLYLVMVAAALSVIILSLAGVATITGVLPLRDTGTGMVIAPDVEQGCRRCGMIESVWSMDEDATAADPSQLRYAVRVFMEDGNYRTLYYSEPPVFQTGERVKVSDGTLILR